MDSISNSVTGVAEDSLVMTPNGLEKAKDIRPGREVLTADNQYSKVTSISSTRTEERELYKISMPLLEGNLGSDLYVGKDTVFYGMPQKSDLATEIAVSQLSAESYIFLPSKVRQHASLLSYHLKTEDVITERTGAFIPVGNITTVKRVVSVIDIETKYGSFVAGGAATFSNV